MIAAVTASVTTTGRLRVCRRTTRREDRGDREVEAEQTGDGCAENDSDRPGDAGDERQPPEPVGGA